MDENIKNKIDDFKVKFNQFDFKTIKKKDSNEVWKYLERALNEILDLFKDDYFIDSDILNKMNDIKTHIRTFLSSPMYDSAKVNNLCREYIDKDIKEFEDIINLKYC